MSLLTLSTHRTHTWRCCQIYFKKPTTKNNLTLVTHLHERFSLKTTSKNRVNARRHPNHRKPSSLFKRPKRRFGTLSKWPATQVSNCSEHGLKTKMDGLWDGLNGSLAVVMVHRAKRAHKRETRRSFWCMVRMRSISHQFHWLKSNMWLQPIKNNHLTNKICERSEQILFVRSLLVVLCIAESNK